MQYRSTDQCDTKPILKTPVPPTGETTSQTEMVHAGTVNRPFLVELESDDAVAFERKENRLN